MTGSLNDLARDRPHAVSGDVSGAARRQPRRQGAGVRPVGAGGARHPGRPPPTGIAASTTPRPAAGPAWCCAPTCWPPRSMPPTSPPDRPRLLMSPRGRPLTQSRVAELAAGPGPLIVCGRFEGVDQRVIEARGLEEVSIGDYVLSGGEIAAMALIDACVRLLPGVMGKQASGDGRKFLRRLTGIPPIYPPAGVRGPPDPGNPGFRRPCQGRRLAAGRGRGPDPGPAAGFMGRQGRPKTAKKHDRRVTSARLMPYTGAKSARRIDGRLRSPRRLAGRAADGDFNEPHSAARKRAVRQARRDQGNPGIRPRRHRDRQRQGGRRRAHPRAGL